MNDQINNQFFAFTKQLADGAFKAQSLALNSLETLAEMQFKAMQHNAEISSQFVAEALETRDIDGLRSLWEKGASFSRDNAERAMTTSQEMLAVTQKTAESLSALAQEQGHAAKEAATAPVDSKKKAAK